MLHADLIGSRYFTAWTGTPSFTRTRHQLHKLNGASSPALVAIGENKWNPDLYHLKPIYRYLEIYNMRIKSMIFVSLRISASIPSSAKCRIAVNQRVRQRFEKGTRCVLYGTASVIHPE